MCGLLPKQMWPDEFSDARQYLLSKTEIVLTKLKKELKGNNFYPESENTLQDSFLSHWLLSSGCATHSTRRAQSCCWPNLERNNEKDLQYSVLSIWCKLENRFWETSQEICFLAQGNKYILQILLVYGQKQIYWVKLSDCFSFLLLGCFHGKIFIL